jgi:intracellular multiplication protein IcmN
MGIALRRSHVGFSSKTTWLAALMILLVLSGCQKKVWVGSEEPRLPYKVAGASDPTMMTLQKRLNKKGVRVITIGQDYLISIPSSALFPNESPQLMWDSYALLNVVVCYLKQFRKIAINVTAYSNKCVSAKRDRALTLARARAVGDYLWSQGIDSRFIFTRGLGSDKPIIAYELKGDKSQNSRIEITFRDAVA